MIQEHIECEKQLTVHICSGTILQQELIEAVRALFVADPNPNHLWDLSETDLSQIKGDALEEIAKLAKQYAPTRISGRTAFVSPSDLGFGLARMYEVFAEDAGLRTETGVFRSRKEAEDWLSEC